MPLENIKRIFRIPDDKMFEAAKAKRSFFIQDKADFVTFDADFDDPFADDFLTLINDAEILPDDETVVDLITQETAAVEKQMQKCRDKFQDTKFFIEKAFPDDAGVQNEFGFNDYRVKRKTQTLMIKFMRKFHTVAEKYKTQLISAGYPQLKIDEIKTLGNALSDTNNEQEVFIGSQPTITQLRIKAYNGVWEIVQKICAAGKRIYKDDFAKYQRYLLPPGEESEDALSIFGKATDSVTHAAIVGLTVTISGTTVSVTTDADGNFVFGGLVDGTYTLLCQHPDYNDLSVDVTIVDGEPVERDLEMVHV